MNRRRTVRIALGAVLVVSLAVNLVVLGFWLERSMNTRPPAPERLAERATNAIIGRLPDKVRDPLVKSVLARDAELTAAVREIRRSRRAVRAALRAEPLDMAAVEKALNDTRKASDALLELIDQEVLKTLPGIPAADRATIRGRDP